jgi:4-hydroxybenzoyl-CoA thioesterase
MIETAIERWFEDGIDETYARWLTEDCRALPRVKIRCRFIAPCRWGGRLDLSVFVRKVRRSSVDLTISGAVAGETRLVASIIVVLISLETFQALPFPDPVREKLLRYQSRFRAPSLVP